MVGIDLIKDPKLHTTLHQDKTLLVLTPCYPNGDSSIIGDMFVKYQLEEIRKYFRKIIVISPILFSFRLLSKDKMCRDYTYANIEIYYPRCFYIPFFWYGPYLIDNRLIVIERLIKKKNFSFNLIHSHFTWPFAHIGLKLKEKYGKPVITTIHENGKWFDHEVRMNHPLIAKAWSGADALIRVNKIDVPTLKHYNDRVYSIPNGFSNNFHPIDMTTAREQLGLPQDMKILFTLGYLIKRKGFNYLIDAMEKVLQQRNDVLCFIGGAGKEKKTLQEQIDQLNLGDKIRLIGSVPSDQLTLWINASDIFVLPSLNEGNPTVMFEALGCGKPFIGTTVGGVPEIITSDDYGFQVKPGDADDLAEKISKALKCVWEREKILKYAEQYNWENLSHEIIAVYNIIQDSKTKTLEK